MLFTRISLLYRSQISSRASELLALQQQPTKDIQHGRTMLEFVISVNGIQGADWTAALTHKANRYG